MEYFGQVERKIASCGFNLQYLVLSAVDCLLYVY